MFGVKSVRCGYIYDIDRWVFRQLLVPVIAAGCPEFFGEFPCPGGIPGCNGRQACVSRQVERDGKLIGYFSGTDDAPIISLHDRKLQFSCFDGKRMGGFDEYRSSSVDEEKSSGFDRKEGVASTGNG